jgi:hypothetical protein
MLYLFYLNIFMSFWYEIFKYTVECKKNCCCIHASSRAISLKRCVRVRVGVGLYMRWLCHPHPPIFWARPNFLHSFKLDNLFQREKHFDNRVGWWSREPSLSYFFFYHSILPLIRLLLGDSFARFSHIDWCWLWQQSWRREENRVNHASLYAVWRWENLFLQ